MRSILATSDDEQGVGSLHAEDPPKPCMNMPIRSHTAIDLRVSSHSVEEINWVKGIMFSWALTSPSFHDIV